MPVRDPTLLFITETGFRSTIFLHDETVHLDAIFDLFVKRNPGFMEIFILYFVYKISIFQAGPPLGMFGFSPESFPNMLARNPNFLAAAAAAAGPMGLHPPAMKKPRKSTEPRPRGGSPNKDPHKRLKSKSQNVLPTPNNSTNNLSVSTNNNYADDDEDGSLKIDEDADPGNKENLESKMDTGTDDIAEIGDSNGVSEEEEEPSMPGPGGELTDAASKAF